MEINPFWGLVKFFRTEFGYFNKKSIMLASLENLGLKVIIRSILDF